MLLIPLLALLSFCGTQGEEKELTLDVLHINDIHSYFEETNKDSARCKESTDHCYGGIARIYTKQKEIRDLNPETTIFLNAGDFYQGTLWYSAFKYEPMIKFGNRLNYTAMGLGNHDFDDGVKGLIPFADGTQFDLLASNMVLSNETELEEGKHFSKSVVKEINGTKVGIIGFITQSTSYNFKNYTITFTDEIKSIKAEAERLDGEGVKVLIALGHSGYDIEQKIAEQVPLLDLVVGGHSHTFLYTPVGESDVPEDYVQGPYPTYVLSESGKKVPVVQAKAYTKYLGHLTLHFDVNGDLKTPIEGEGVSFAKPYLMDSSVTPDPETLKMMEPYQTNLAEYKTTLGITSVDMFIPGIGDSEESNLGNAIADSMATAYNDTTIAIINNGGIRNNIEAGNITGEDIFYVLPFGNTIDRIKLKGAQLKKAIERAAFKLDVNDPDVYPGFGLQFTGFRLEITVTETNAGNRVSLIQTMNSSGNYENLDNEKTYTIAIGSYLAPQGAQKYARGIFDNLEYEEYIPGTVADYDAMRDWVVANNPLSPTIEGKLKIEYIKSSSASSVSALSLLAYSILRTLV